jgi:uncharacterized protein YjbJ (UPF0337 family)
MFGIDDIISKGVDFACHELGLPDEVAGLTKLGIGFIADDPLLMAEGGKQFAESAAKDALGVDLKQYEPEALIAKLGLTGDKANLVTTGLQYLKEHPELLQAAA